MELFFAFPQFPICFLGSSGLTPTLRGPNFPLCAVRCLSGRPRRHCLSGPARPHNATMPPSRRHPFPSFILLAAFTVLLLPTCTRSQPSASIDPSNGGDPFPSSAPLGAEPPGPPGPKTESNVDLMSQAAQGQGSGSGASSSPPSPDKAFYGGDGYIARPLDDSNVGGANAGQPDPNVLDSYGPPGPEETGEDDPNDPLSSGPGGPYEDDPNDPLSFGGDGGGEGGRRAGATGGATGGVEGEGWNGTNATMANASRMELLMFGRGGGGRGGRGGRGNRTRTRTRGGGARRRPPLHPRPYVSEAAAEKATANLEHVMQQWEQASVP